MTDIKVPPLNRVVAAAPIASVRPALVDVHTLAVEQIRSGGHLYLFQAHWSDGAVTSARHTFDVLYAAHCTLLDLYPAEAGKLDEERVIPPFPGRKIVKGLTKAARATSAHTVAQKRLREIAVYMTGLVKLPTIASAREFVTLFDSQAALSSRSAATHGRDELSVQLVGFLVKQGGAKRNWKRRHCLLDTHG